MFKITCNYSDNSVATYVLNKGRSEDVYSAGCWLKENGKWGIEITKHIPTSKAVHNECDFVAGGFCSYYTVSQVESDGRPTILTLVDHFAQAIEEKESWAAYLHTTMDNRGSYNTNSIRLATAAEAKEYAKQMSANWMSVIAWVVVPSSDPVNYKFDNGLVRLEN